VGVIDTVISSGSSCIFSVWIFYKLKTHRVLKIRVVNMKKIFILSLVLVVVVILPAQKLKAAVISDPYCSYFYSDDQETLFSDYQSHNYNELGLSEFHFKLSPNGIYNDGRSWEGWVGIYDNDCNQVAAFGSRTDDNIFLPAGTENFSLRFLSPTHFQIWNDDINQQVNCSFCDTDFSSSNLGPNLKVAFSGGMFRDGVFDPITWSWVVPSQVSDFSSDTFPIVDPSIIVNKVPVLIVPGIMGTTIFKNTQLLWPDVISMLMPFSNDSFMNPLAFKKDGYPLDTSLTLGSVIDKAATLDYSQGLVNDFISQGYSTATNLSLFAYDWRDDIEKNSENFLKPEIDSIVNSSPSGNIDIVAHSQGGLILKRLLYDHPEYASKINKLIFVGTPNLGAPFAAKALLYGDNMGIHFGPLHLSSNEVQKISQNMPAIYQLLPSVEYFSHSSGYLGNLDPSLSLIGGTNYNFSQTSQALKDLGENSALIDQANTFHSSSYDNMDFSNTGIQTYNIMGCESGTVGQILLGSDGKYHLNYRPGDGTVPLISASNIYGSQNYYSLNTGGIHAAMLTTDGIRQQIENILTGSSLPTNNLTQDSGQCRFDGQQVSVHSPVDLQIYDENGDHVGPNADGSFDYNIDGVQYDTIGHDKFAYLPPGHTYTVKLPATAGGNFSFDSSVIQDGGILDTAHYNAIPITASSTATVVLNTQNDQTIQLDVNGDGSNVKTIQPSAILNPDQSQDITPPMSTSTVTGMMGQAGYYRSNVSVGLSAADPVVNSDPSQTSGVLNIQYSLDNATTTGYQSPISVTAEGAHTISFFATDKAGNNEQAQTINFVIDKTSPEAVAQFSPSLKDIQFTGMDNISTTSKVTVLDNANDILLTDQAGNTTEIKLKEKNRKISMGATIQSLSYNGTAQDISKNVLAFLWAYDKNNNLTLLSQNAAAKKTYVILALYNGKKTSLAGIDKTGIILKSITGLDLLKISTNKGDLAWSY
jgi:Lecithin:cholesterol acyltransferase